MPEIAMKVGQTVAEKMVTGAPKGPTGGESDFSKLLTEKLDQSSSMHQKIIESFGLSPQKEMQAVSAEGLDIRSDRIASTHEIRTEGKIVDLLTDVNRDALQMDNIIEMATSGKKFTAGELLAMQAGVAQITLSIELTGKAFEQVNTGTKQLLQTNFA